MADTSPAGHGQNYKTTFLLLKSQNGLIYKCIENTQGSANRVKTRSYRQHPRHTHLIRYSLWKLLLGNCKTFKNSPWNIYCCEQQNLEYTVFTQKYLSARAVSLSTAIMYTDELSGRGEQTRDGGSASRIQVEVVRTTECMYGERKLGQGYSYWVELTIELRIKNCLGLQIELIIITKRVENMTL